MDLLSGLPQPSSATSTPPAGVADVLAQAQRHIQQLQAEKQELASQKQELLSQKQLLECKNQKLELAILRRLRFGARSEALNAEQRTLFEDDTEQDLAAVSAEVEASAPASPRQPRSRAGPTARPRSWQDQACLSVGVPQQRPGRRPAHRRLRLLDQPQRPARPRLPRRLARQTDGR